MGLFKRKKGDDLVATEAAATPGNGRAFEEAFASASDLLRSNMPPGAGRGEIWDVAERCFGSHSYPSPESFAIEWVGDAIDDLRPRLDRGGMSARVTRILTSSHVVEAIPGAMQTIVRLAEDLYNGGDLGPPYDERTDFGPDVVDDTGGRLQAHDPGPSRLAALVALAAYASRLAHSRASEWRNAAAEALRSNPTASSVMSPVAQEFVAELQLSMEPVAPQEPALIWVDPDVELIVDTLARQPNLHLHHLDGAAQELVGEFIRLDQMVNESAPTDLVVDACLAAVRCVELLPATLPNTHAVGWKKFVLYMTSFNAQLLWNQHHDERAAAIGGWLLEALERVGVRPDGFATALGSAYSSTMSITGAATVLDPVTGEMRVRGGDDGRRLAGLTAGSE